MPDPAGGEGQTTQSASAAREQTETNKPATATNNNGAKPDVATDPQGDQSTTEQQKYTQSDLDAAISRALKTREENLKREFEEKQLQEAQEFKTLYEREAAQRKRLELARETQRVFADAGLPQLADVIDGDLSDIDGRTAFARQIRKLIDKQVEERIAERLKTSKAPASGASSEPKRPDQMTPEEYQEHRKKLGIH